MNESHHPKIATLALSLEKFTLSCLMDIRDSGTRFAMAGSTGVGKTHCAERIARFIGTHQVDAWSRGWWSGSHVPQPLLLRWPQEAGRGQDEWAERMDQANKARLVILDDLGAENDRYKNDETTVRLHELFEALRPAWKWVLVTTNVPVARWKDRWDQRIADRLFTFSRIDLTNVPSYRVANPGSAR